MLLNNPELVAIIALSICVLVLVCEYVWLIILAHKQESHIRKYDDATRRIDEMLEAILYSPTQEAMLAEIETLRQYVGTDPIKMDTLSTRTLGLLLSQHTDDQQKAAVVAVSDALRSPDFYAELLHKGHAYEKAYACRKVAFYYVENELPTIRKLAHSKKREISYNASMALAAFGDEDSLVEIILGLEKDYNYSFRIILELMATYTGDLRSLARRVFERCSEYIKATVIKGLSSHAYTEFEDIYLEGLHNKNTNLKIACVLALGKIGKPEYEHALITAAHDKNWMVRSAVMKELAQLGTDNAKQALAKATSDPEWWVRYNAAKSLVSVDPDLTYVESVLQGYDKYGSDVIKYMLYRHYNKLNP